jgi:hypothetical protein
MGPNRREKEGAGAVAMPTWPEPVPCCGSRRGQHCRRTLSKNEEVPRDPKRSTKCRGLRARMGPAKVKVDLAITGAAQFCEAWAREVRAEG